METKKIRAKKNPPGLSIKEGDILELRGAYWVVIDSLYPANLGKELPKFVLVDKIDYFERWVK